MKLINLKKPKTVPDAKTMEDPMSYEDRYPYGTRLDFNDKMVQKLPVLEKLDAGDSVVIQAKGLVIQKRVNSNAKVGSKKKKTTLIEIQITDIGVADKSNYDDAFSEASKK